MPKEYVYSVCGMCTVRCPIRAEVEDGRVSRLEGNPHAPGIEGSLCPRGAAGVALTYDDERPQAPLIRAGERGEGKWRQVSWDEALDFVAGKLDAVRSRFGARAILFSDRGGPFTDLHRAFVRGLGSPNYCNHDSACARNVQHASLSLFGMGRTELVHDLKKARHVVLQTRNILEAVNVKEVNDLLDAKEAGATLSVIDIRANVPACKADNFFLIRPGTDLAFNLAVIHALLANGLHDKAFADRFIKDMDALRAFIEPYTPAWAEAETGVAAAAVEDFARQLAAAAPAVIWHPGWMASRYRNSFQVCRTAYIVNALLGAIGAKGGLPLSNKPSDFGRKGLKSLQDLFEKPRDKRADGVGWDEGRTHFDAGPGLVHLNYQAMATGRPYPVKAYIAHRHDPLMAFPDPEHLKSLWRNLDLLVSVTFTWSDTAWFSDVVLPMSPYLERESIIASKGGLKPQFFVRRRAMQPRFDTRAEWEIYAAGLARRLGLAGLCFDSIEDIWRYQLEGTGVAVEDFAAKGFVELSDAPRYRTRDELAFKTPSGKIELVCAALEKDGQKSLAPYAPPDRPPEGRFRITFGRCALHTQGHTVNNPLLFEQVSENVLWINADAAQRLGIRDGEQVEIGGGGHAGRIKALVTEFIHPEAVFMLHGFGHTLPVESRARGKGVADNLLMPRGIEKWDRCGGGVAMQEHFVSVRRIE